MDRLVLAGLVSLAEDEIVEFLQRSSGTAKILPGPSDMLCGAMSFPPATQRHHLSSNLLLPLPPYHPYREEVTSSSVLWLLRDIVLVAKELVDDPIDFLRRLSFDSFCLAYIVASSLHFHHTLDLLLKSLKKGGV